MSKRFAPAQALAVDELSLDVAPGEIVALLGPSGGGKTTALRIIAGLEAPDAGTVTIGGRVVAGPGRAVPPEARGVGLVFQDGALFPHLTVADNVAFGLRDRPRGPRRERVDSVLAMVGLSGLGARYPHELSGGQQQRVALARALAPAPALLLLDEPFSSLDAELRAQMRDEVERLLRTTGTTAVLVTHDLDDAFAVADRVGVLRAGRIEQIAPPSELYLRPATRFVAGFVGAADFVPGTVGPDGIVCELGVFPGADGFRAGERVEVLVRPDDVRFVAGDAGPATVVRRHFRGAHTVYDIRLSSGHRVQSRRPSSAPLAVGARGRALARLDRAVAFPAAGPDLSAAS